MDRLGDRSLLFLFDLSLLSMADRSGFSFLNVSCLVERFRLAPLALEGLAPLVFEGLLGEAA